MWWRKGKGDADPALGEPSPTSDARETVDVGEPVRRVASGGIGDVPLAFAARELLRFATNVAAANV